MDVYEREMIEKQADEYWASFVDEITYNNRFFPKHPIMNFFKSYAASHLTVIKAGTILYRARNIDYDSPSAESTGIVKYIQGQDWGDFAGFDEKNSFVPPAKSVSAGRINPEKIVYLYTAQEIITAIAETRPRLFDHVSVAKIELLRDVNLVDFQSKYDPDNIDFSSEVIRNLTAAFSMPCKDSIEYIPTQFISEYIKSLGYDGVSFRSSFNLQGTNITLFHPSAARAIASTEYRMDDITYRARRIFPRNSLDAFEIIATNAPKD